MKILKGYPKTVSSLIADITRHEDPALIVLNIGEIIKNLPEEVVKADSCEIVALAIPIIFVNRFKQSDPKLRGLCRKIYQQLSDMSLVHLSDAHS